MEDMILTVILDIHKVPLMVWVTYHQHDSLRDLLVQVAVGITIVLLGGTEIHQLALPRAVEEAIVAMIWAAIVMDHRVAVLNIVELDTIIIQSPLILLNHKTQIMDLKSIISTYHIMLLYYLGAFNIHIH